MEEETNARRYLDLLENALAFMLWPDPPIPVETLNYKRGIAKRWLAICGSRVAALIGAKICMETTRTHHDRLEGIGWPLLADTMIGHKRLRSLRNCLTLAIREGVPGDFIETGVWRGGACVLARAVFVALGETNRRVFVADSFAGLPAPESERFSRSVDAGDEHYKQDFLRVSLEEVRTTFCKYDLLDEKVVFLKGWFKDTLPHGPFENFAVIRLDGDMYSSTMDALTSLYPRLSPGGFCIVDDYALSGCRQAVDEYRLTRNIRSPMESIDWTGIFWRKPSR